MNKKLLDLFVKMAEGLDDSGLYAESEVVDNVLRKLVARKMSLYVKEAEKEMVDNWITYNRTVDKVKDLKRRATELRDTNEGASNDRVGS